MIRLKNYKRVLLSPHNNIVFLNMPPNNNSLPTSKNHEGLESLWTEFIYKSVNLLLNNRISWPIDRVTAKDDRALKEESSSIIKEDKTKEKKENNAWVC